MHLVLANKGFDRDVWVNFALVRFMEPHVNGGTRIVFSGIGLSCDYLDVEESFELITKLLTKRSRPPHQ